MINFNGYFLSVAYPAFFKPYAHCLIVQDLKEALKEAVKFSKDDDCVLFSPACSSLDMFKDYKDRGDTFKRLIKDLNDE